MKTRIGIIGARGYVGSELIRLIAGHPDFELAFVASRERAGQRLGAHEHAEVGDLHYNNPTPEEAAQLGADAIVLALPNGMASEFVAAVDARSELLRGAAEAARLS